MQIREFNNYINNFLMEFYHLFIEFRRKTSELVKLFFGLILYFLKTGGEQIRDNYLKKLTYNPSFKSCFLVNNVCRRGSLGLAGGIII